MARHSMVAALLAGLVALNMWAWLDPELLPGHDFAGYVTVVEDVHNQLLEHGGLPSWNSKWFGGSTQFMSYLKERLAFPAAYVFGPLVGTKLTIYVLRVLAGMVMYLGFARYLRAPLVGAVTGCAYAFCTSASYSTLRLDVMLSYALFPAIFVAALETLRSRSLPATVALGALIAAEFCTNLAHSLVAPLMVLLLALLQPWRSTYADRLFSDPPLLLSWVGRISLAFVVFHVFAASQIAWFALDQHNHTPHAVENVEKAIHIHSEPSPFTLINRANWLGSWLQEHDTPFMRDFEENPLLHQRRYVGGVALLVIAVGWFAGRGDRVLRRAYQVFALLFLAQWAVAMGPHSLAWLVARSFRWPMSLDGMIALGLGLAAASCLAAAAGLWWTRERRGSHRIELLLGCGLLFALAAYPVFDLLRSWLPFFAHFRAPGKYMDLLPFAFHGLFGLGLVALTRRVPERAHVALLAAVLVLVVADHWPGRKALEQGTRAEPVRQARQALRDFPAQRRDGRLVMMRPSDGIEGSYVAVASALDTGSGWLHWQASRHASEFAERAMGWLILEPGDKKMEMARTLGRTTSRIGRYRYYLDEYPTHRPGPDPGEPWIRRMSNQRFALWEQPPVLPEAFGYRSYVTVVGSGMAKEYFLVVLAHQLGAATVSAEDWDELSPPVAEKTILLVDLEPKESNRHPLAEEYADKTLQAGVADHDRRFMQRLGERRQLVPVEYHRPSSDRMELEVDAGAEPVLVFVSESHHPWWRARVDGRPAPLLRAHVAFMAVPVEPGRHVIELNLERPPVIVAADLVTWLAWLGLVPAIGLFALRSSRT